MDDFEGADMMTTGGDRSVLVDPQTGLPNRLHASVHLEAAWGAALRGSPLSLVLFGLDVAPSTGGTSGGLPPVEARRAVAEVLRERTRRMDLSASLDPHRFLTILSGCPPARARVFADSILAAVQDGDAGTGPLTLSAGISAADGTLASPESLLSAAEKALAAAREAGGNTVVAPHQAEARPPHTGTSHEGTAPPGPARPTPLGLTVAVVDDDDATLRAARRILEHLGCAVHAFASPQEALAFLGGNPNVDLVVTDIVMPEMSGFTFVEQLVRVRPHMPALYMSGYAQEEVYWGGTPGARSAFLGKPLEVAALREAIVELVGNGRGPPATRAWRDAAHPDPPTVPTVGSDATRRPGAPVPETHSGDARRPRPEHLEARILIADDDEAVVRSLQRLFARAGYRKPHGVLRPRHPAELIRPDLYDLLILDLHMPDLDGFEVLEAVRAMVPDEAYFPVLVLTGDDDPEVRRRALAAGAMDFLNKPFDPAEAEARVRNLVSTRILTRRVAEQRDSLEERVLERTAELADTRAEILHRLARAAEYRDDVTGRHADRVGMLASRIAAEMGWSVRDVDLIRRTAPLHDIGKIGVPDAILNKPGRLNAAEYELVKAHTTIGAEILGGSRHRILQIAENIARSHHERWDGRGYPDGRPGPDIPLEARIVAVADTFDVISHRRPYKEALSPAQALEEIRRCAGTHFDPEVVDAFAAIADRVGLDALHGVADPIDPWRDTTGPDTSSDTLQERPGPALTWTDASAR